jgi:hypothetical protein
MNTIDVIEEYFGDELTEKTAKKIGAAPPDHIVPLVEKLDEHYERWFAAQQDANEQSAAATDTGNYFYCMEPFPPEGNGRAIASRYKKFLLYFPRLAIPDPIADVLYPPIIVAHVLNIFPDQVRRGSFPWDARLQEDFRDAVQLLAEIAPAVKRQDLRLLPNPYLIFSELVQKAAQSELDALSRDAHRESYYRPIEEAAMNKHTMAGYARHLTQLKVESSGRTARPADFLVSMQEILERDKDTLPGAISWIVAEHIKLAGQICARLNYTALAGDEAVYAALMQEYKLAGNSALPPNKAQRVATDLIRYDIPGIGNADLRTILAIRRDEDAFEAFRRDFGSLMDRVHQEQPADQQEFEREFRQAADDILRPRIDEVNKTLSVSVIEKSLVPAALSVGAGAVAHSFLGASTFPVTAAAATLLTPANWVLLKLHSRWTRRGRKAEILRDAYSMLLENL